MNLDRIDKEIILRASPARVWRAIASAEEFGAWFGVKLDGSFAPGARIKGQLTIPGHEHVSLEFAVEQVDPERLLSFRWHPYAMEPGVDYSDEPMTLVEFRLAAVPGGTRLTVVESGFERIPAARRAEAFPRNDAGWTEQVKNLERYLADNVTA